jgi:hypothetical protein
MLPEGGWLGVAEKTPSENHASDASNALPTLATPSHRFASLSLPDLAVHRRKPLFLHESAPAS